MAYDFKKEFKELYKPSCKPSILTIPPMSYIAVRGKGDPNIEGGEYQGTMPLPYGVAYTVKMSKKGPHEIEGYFDFVVPPLEGFWWQDPADDQIDYAEGRLQLHLLHPPARFRHSRRFRLGRLGGCRQKEA